LPSKKATRSITITKTITIITIAEINKNNNKRTITAVIAINNLLTMEILLLNFKNNKIPKAITK